MLMPFIAAIAEMVIVFKLGDYSDYLMKGCIINFIGSLMSLVPPVIMIAGLIIKIFGAYYMFKGHCEILIGIDDILAAKWEKLFIWYKIPAIIIVVFTVVMIVGLFSDPFVVVLFLALVTKDKIIEIYRVVTIYLIVIKCLEVYYLYKTHVALSRHEAKENVDPE